MGRLLTFSDRARLRARDVEFRLPFLLTKMATTLGVLTSPYTAADDDLRAIFFHIPKAAGTSIRMSLYGCRSYHIPAVRYLAADADRFSAYFKFCVTRNPWDRLNSAFHYLWSKRNAGSAFRDHRWAADHLSGCTDFRHFVYKLDDDDTFRSTVRRYIHFRDQADWITAPGSRRRPLVDFIGRYEYLDEDFRALARRLGRTSAIATARVRAQREDYRWIFDSRMVDIVAQLYAADVELLGYGFE